MVNVSRCLDGESRLSRHMVETMAAMRRQFVIRRIGRRGSVEVHCGDGCVRACDAEIASAELARAMKDRCQQAKYQRDDKRQAAMPTAALPCTDLETASHGLPVESLSGIFKAG